MTYCVGDLIADFLRACRLDTAFGLVSAHNIPILDAVGRSGDLRFIMARGETGASHMADGYARATGKLGVLVTSTGPGAANAVPGLLEAGFASTPVLHITGQAGSQYVGRRMGAAHDVPDQIGMLSSVSKAAFSIQAPQQVLGTLIEAVTIAMTPPQGPVSIEIPIDIQRAAIARSSSLDHLCLPVPAPVVPQPQVLAELVARVRRARRPMLWLGNGARGAGAAARRLLDHGFGMVSSWGGRGIVDEDHPLNLGGLNGIGAPRVQAWYRECDLLLVVGSRLRGHETNDFSLQLPQSLIQIDIDPRADGRTYANQLFVQGDASLVLEDLAERLAGWAPEAHYAEAFSAMKQSAHADFKATLGPYKTFPDQLRAAMPRDAIWARDITIAQSSWGNRVFPVYGSRNAIHPVGAGIGTGLGLAIGAAVGAGERKTILLTGDGGFMLTLTELWTAVQYKTNLVIIVMNDGGYGVIKHMQDAFHGGRRYYTTLPAPPLKELAELARIPYFRVGYAEHLGDSVRRALVEAGPTLVEVDMDAIGPAPPYAPYDRKPA